VADGIKRDTTTNQKQAGAEEERMEKRNERWGVAAEGCKFSAGLPWRETEEDKRIIDDCSIFLAMAHIAVAKIP
jgi:hypothetical protein